MSLRLTELHPAYQTVCSEVAIQMANLGAEVYLTTEAALRLAWAAEMSADEMAKAERWRQEGRAAVLDEIQGQLDEAKIVALQLADAKASLAALRASVDAEAARRAEELMESARKEYELVSLRRLHEMEKSLMVAEERNKHIPHYEDKVAYQRAQITKLTDELVGLRETLHKMELERVQESTKSSHALGKMGEATVMEMLQNVIMPAFPYSSVKDMADQAHSADFHVRIMTPTGRRVKFLVDSKNYSKPVNVEEIHKLYSDVDADEEAHCGILISLASAIHKVRQFEIRMTEKHKPVLFLSFQDCADEQRGEILCWGFRALLALVRDGTGDGRADMMDRLMLFLESMTNTIKEIDGIITSQTRSTEALRQVKTSMLKKITDFRVDAELEKETDEILDTIQHEADGCVTVLRSTGQRCGKQVHAGGTKCRHHTSRKERFGGDAGAAVEPGGGPQGI